VQAAREQCNEIYESHFINGLTEMCPHQEFTQIHHRPPTALLSRQYRVIPIIIGVIVLINLAVVGMALTGTIMGSLNSNRIDEQQDKLEEIEQRLKISTEQIEKLRVSFNEVLQRLSKHQQDYDEFKAKSLSTNFAISYITSRLTMAKEILAEATRQWKLGKVYAPLIDYLNFTLPCREECPLRFARAQKCYLSDDNQRLYLHFTVSVIHTDLVVVEADPFQLMMKNPDTKQTCTLVYNGPKNAILSQKDKCITTLNVKQPVTQELLLSPSRICKPQESFSKDAHYFHNSTCKNSHPKDEYDFVQVKPTRSGYYVYCPGSSIMMDGRTEPCPSHVFIVPLQTDFTINNDEFIGSRLDLEHQEVLDSRFSHRVNWQLQSTFNWSQYEVSKPAEPEPTHHQTIHHYSLGFAAVCVVIIIILIFALVYTFRHKFGSPMQITVTAHDDVSPSAPPATTEAPLDTKL
jgi:hypothetical protein